MNISFEVVPRSQKSMKEQINFIEQNLSFINTINAPDLLRFPIRSWDILEHVKVNKYQFIPHVRAIDFDLKNNQLLNIIDKYALDKVLIVSGDPPPDMSFNVYDTNVIDLIASIRKKFPNIEIYAGFDPYRNSIKQEHEYISKKLDAGVDFLLSQPFFDLRLLEIYSEFIPANKVYWGVSPVITEKSKHYWKRMNHAIFPADYEPSYEWNINFSKKVLSHCQKNGSNLYFMPIRIDLEKFFFPIVEHISTLKINQ